MVDKVYRRVLIERVRRKTDDVIVKMQDGFRQNRGCGCVHQVFIVRQVCEKNFSKGKNVYWV